MANIITFKHPQFGIIRGMEINGKPWLVGKDAAIALGYKNPGKALADHVDADHKFNNKSLSSLGQRGGWLINETGFYSLAFSSKLPNARALREWITVDVFPQLNGETVSSVLSSQCSLFDDISDEKCDNTEEKVLKTNGLEAFCNSEFGSIRGLEIDGEAWLVGKDVAEILGYKNTKDALNVHVDQEDKQVLQRSQITTFENHTSSLNLSTEIPNRGLTIINESGLYSLALSSKLPGAKKFKRWVTKEVIPSIRKHGAYITPDTLEQMIASPEFGIRLLTALKEEQEKRKKLETEVLLMRPKADYYDALVDSNLLTNFRDTAKELHTKQNAFITLLLEKKYLYRGKTGKLLPYQKHVDSGFFEIKEVASDSSGWAGIQTLITPKGREAFRQLLAV